MRTRLIIIVVGIAIIPGLALTESPAQEGTGESIGRRIDRGLEQLTDEVREAWAKARKQVDQLGVQGRVYGRLRWDKALADQPIDVDIDQKPTEQGSTVILTGRVPDENAREKAIELAQDTVGVREVIDRLQVEPRPEVEDRTSSATPSETRVP
jgi:BON domain